MLKFLCWCGRKVMQDPLMKIMQLRIDTLEAENLRLQHELCMVKIGKIEEDLKIEDEHII